MIAPQLINRVYWYILNPHVNEIWETQRLSFQWKTTLISTFSTFQKNDDFYSSFFQI